MSAGAQLRKDSNMPDDYSADTQAAGRIVISASRKGEIETAGDRDWFSVKLEAGKTYRFDLKGAVTLDGTLLDPYLRGIHDASGALLAGTTADHGGTAMNSRVEFTAPADGVYYVAVGSRYEEDRYGSRLTEGTYTLSVTNVPSPGETGEAPSFEAADYIFALEENADGSEMPVSLGSVSATDPDNALYRGPGARA